MTFFLFLKSNENDGYPSPEATYVDGKEELANSPQALRRIKRQEESEFQLILAIVDLDDE